MANRALDLTFAERCYRQSSNNLHHLSLEQSSENDKVKEIFLKAYELVPEAYRQK